MFSATMCSKHWQSLVDLCVSQLLSFKKETYIVCLCYLQNVGGIVKARLNAVTVYLLTVFMVFTCFNSHHYVSVNDCLCYELPVLRM